MENNSSTTVNNAEVTNRRKRNCSSSSSDLSLKRAKVLHDIDVNASPERSNDSFDSFDEPVVAIKRSPQSKRSEAIYLSDEDDSFDEPVIVEKKIESGVSGFPDCRRIDSTVYLTVKTVTKREDCLDVECDGVQGPCIVYLQGSWSDTKVDSGSKIRLIGAKKWGKCDFLVDDQVGVVISNPDTLIPCTAIAGSSWCARKVILNDRFRGPGECNKAMLIGTIIHELFQIAVQERQKKITADYLLNICRSQLLPKCTEELVALLLTPNMFETELVPYLEVIINWIRKHLPHPTLLKPLPLPSGSNVVEIHDIEDNIWNPILGVKGKIDATIKVRNSKGQIGYESLELKTGKSGHSTEHAAQVFLYCMMLSERHNQLISSGNLLYLKDGVSRPVEPRAPELKGILQQRNNLSSYYGKLEWEQLPEPKNDPRFCEKCDHNIMCSVFQKDVENMSKSSEKMQEFAGEMTAHLEPVHIEYMKRWMKCISAEFREERKRDKMKVEDLWLKSPEERELKGSCLEGLEIVEEKGWGSENVVIELKRSTSLHENVFTIGDICLISTSTKFGIAFATVVDLKESSISVRCERGIKKRHQGPYCLDRYSSFSNYSATMGSVVFMMGRDEKSNHLRRLLIDLAPPLQHEIGVIPAEVKKIIVKAKLNNEQRQAIIHALFANDLTIIEGLPGSGKSTVIAVLVRCLVKNGKSVLMTAFTHSAVDNVLGKLAKELPSESMIRLGKLSVLNDKMTELSIHTKIGMFEDVDKYTETRKMLKSTPVVACTCHHVARDVLFSWRKFDVCIVDEASMVLEPIIIPVLATAGKFVLVGDTKQLAPLVLSKVAREESAGVSLMQRLEKHKESVVSLVSQHRMNQKIASIASHLFYANKLVCGSEGVARACLDRVGGYTPVGCEEEYMKTILGGSIEDSTIFLDTNAQKNQKCHSEDVKEGVANFGEAEICVDICKKMVEGGVNPSDIGIICVYRRQVDVIREKLKMPNPEVNTIDSYQGRDKSVILVSLTWTSSSSKNCELLKEERRLNVALTRAKHKMILIGDKASLETIETVKRVIEVIPKVISYQ